LIPTNTDESTYIMINDELLKYIREQIEKKTDSEAVKKTLRERGWQDRDIEEGLKTMSDAQAADPTIPSTIPAIQITDPRKQGKGAKLTLGFVIALLALGGGLAYFYLYDSPENIIKKAVAAIGAITSETYTGELKIEAENVRSVGGALNPFTQQKASLVLRFDGVTDLTDAMNSKNAVTLSLNPGSLPFGIISLEAKTIQNTTYLKLVTAPKLNFLDVSVLQDKWIKFDLEAIKKQFLGTSQSAPTPTPAKNPWDKDTIGKIKTAIIVNPMLSVSAVLEGEKIENANTYHYRFTLNQKNIKAVFTTIAETAKEDPATLTAQTKNFETFLASIKENSGEIWIGKNDFLPYKLLLSLTIKSNESQPGGKLTLTINLKNFNQLVKIDPPSPVITIEEMFKIIQESALKTAPTGKIPASKTAK